MSQETDDGAEGGAHGGMKVGGAIAPPAPQIGVSSGARELKLFLIAGEHSGDRLGGKLMAALGARRKGLRYLGVGGPEMAAQGLESQFPIEDVAVMGIGAVVRRLPQIVRRVYQSADAAIAAQPDAVVIIDSPEFTHPIAKRIRKKSPAIPIINYVSPSVWAWRPGRARKMRRYIDHVLGLLPFEPGALADLGGPPCSYVGHPLIERAQWIASLDPAPLAKRLQLTTECPVLVVLPGSRGSELKAHMSVFGAAVEKLAHQTQHPPQIIMPIIPSMRARVEERLKDWPVRPHIVDTEADKFRAFALADAALAASGTVTLELAIAGTPMVVGYRLETLMVLPQWLIIRSKSVVLANLVLGQNAFPEFVQRNCIPENLARALNELLIDGPARRDQLAALSGIQDRLQLAQGTPSEAAAEIVLRYAEQGRKA